MSSIKRKGMFDFEDDLGLIRAFKMSLGFRDFKNRKGAPQSTNKFLPEWKRKEHIDPMMSDNARKNLIAKCDMLKKRYQQQLINAYGTDTPDSLDVVFLTDNIEQILPYHLKMYDSKGSLLCKGNGAVYNRPEEITDLTIKEYEIELDENFGQILRGEKPAYKDYVCRGELCPHYQEKRCQVVGNLLFTDINIKPLSVIQIDTGSPTSIKNIIKTIHTVQRQHGSIIGIPFKLYVEREEVRPTVNGKKIKTTVSFLKLAPDFSIREIRRNEIEGIQGKQAEITVSENDLDAYDDNVSLVTQDMVENDTKAIESSLTDEEKAEIEKEERELAAVFQKGAKLGYSENKVKYELKHNYNNDINLQLADYDKIINGELL